MNSDTWFPERLVSDSWVSSRFSILLNYRQTHTCSLNQTQQEKHPFSLNIDDNKLRKYSQNFYSSNKLHVRLCVFRVTHSSEARDWTEKCMADFTGSSQQPPHAAHNSGRLSGVSPHPHATLVHFFTLIHNSSQSEPRAASAPQPSPLLT